MNSEIEENQESNSETENIIGIDLGTTNTYSCFSTRIGNKLQDIHEIHIPQITLEFDEHRDPQLPSMVYFPQDPIFGDDYIVGMTAKKRIISEPDRVIKSSKTKMGTSYTYKIDDKEYFSSEIAEKILTTVKDSYIDYPDHVKGKIVVGVPSRFNADQNKDTRDAVRQVFQEAEIQLREEPEAIALWYLYNEIKGSSQDTLNLIWEKKVRRILIIDIGGGTLDVAIIEASLKDAEQIQKNDPKTYPVITRIGLSDYTPSAGDEFDRLVADHLRNEFYSELSDHEYEDKYINWFLRQAEIIKLNLSHKLRLRQPDDIIRLKLSLPGRKDEIKLVEFNKTKYMEIIKPLLPEWDFAFSHEKINDYHKNQSLNNTILRPIIDAYIQIKEDNRLIEGHLFDEYILAGGMGDFPIVKEIFTTFLDREPVKVIQDSKKAVAKGLVVAGYFESLGNLPQKPIGRNYAFQGRDSQGKRTWDIIIKKDDLLPIFKLEYYAGKLQPGIKEFLFTLGQENIASNDFQIISTKVLRLDPPPIEQIDITLKIIVDVSGALDIIGKRSDNNTEIPLVNFNEDDHERGVSQIQQLDTNTLISEKRILTEKRLEAIIKYKHSYERRIDDSHKKWVKAFTNELKQMKRKSKKITEIRKILPHLTAVSKAYSSLYASYKGRYRKLSNLSERDLLKLNQYLLLFGDIFKGYVIRNQTCPLTLPIDITEELISFIIKENIYDQTFVNLIRLIRYMIAVNPNVEITGLSSLLEYGLLEKNNWKSNSYNILGLIENPPNRLIYKMIQILKKENVIATLHTVFLLGRRYYRKENIDPRLIEEIWSTILHLFSSILENNPFGITIPRWNDIIYSTSLLPEIDITFNEYRSILPKLLMSTAYFVMRENDLQEKKLYTSILKELIEKNTLDEDTHYKAQIIHYLYTKKPIFKEIELEIPMIMIENYLQIEEE